LKAVGAKVVLARTNDHGVGPCIDERAAIGNRVHADLAISLHGDGGPTWGRGFEVIEPGVSISRRNDDRPILGRSYALGAALRDSLQLVPQLVPSTYLGERGIGLRTDLGGLNLSKVPKVLLEICNLRNSEDASLATSRAWRQQVALALVRGIERYRGVNRPTTTTSTLSLTS
ncbi:MAG: N-acetylmuramoyl-L-alanine amidase, partial [Actinomycetota bacterium]